MNWQNFKTYNLGQKTAFEALNNQLFERYLKRTYGVRLTGFQVINGSGGDGGIEALGIVDGNRKLAVQSKFFLQALDKNELGQIKKSILTALKVRPEIAEYIICVPRNLSSVKFTKGNKLTVNDEESRVRAMVKEIAKIHPDLLLSWWFDSDILNQIQQPDNEGVHIYWFEKQVISFDFLKDQFALQKENEWLKERYIPDLHGSGIIDSQYERMVFSEIARDQLIEKLSEAKHLIERTIGLICTFLNTKEYPKKVETGLKQISGNLRSFLEEMEKMERAAKDCNTHFRHHEIEEYPIYPTSQYLEEMPQTNVQKAIVPSLIPLLSRLHTYLLPDFLKKMNSEFTQSIKLVLGNAGSGKTHGLANCVSRHLESGQPAIIVQAKGTPCQNWTQVLGSTLELQDWSKEEIFSALETLAIVNDNRVISACAEGEPVKIFSTALVCIDGLEEESAKQADWCSRIAETVLLAEKYPRIRFLFSARDYFPFHCIDQYNPLYEYIILPVEGDIETWKVRGAYFHYYQIKIENDYSIRGLNNLLSLKLFCEQYQGRTIHSGEEVVTAVRDLINLKVARVNAEFVATLTAKKGVTQKPVVGALTLIAELFYDSAEIEHETLKVELLEKLGSMLDPGEVEQLLDFLVRNVILIRSIRIDKSDVLDKTIITYRITYQTIIEHLLAEKIFIDIKKGKLQAIPKILHRGIAKHPAQRSKMLSVQPNEQIIQYIANRLFAENKQLIGDNNYLIEGFNENAILKFRYKAIAEAPYELAITYAQEIDRLCWTDMVSQYYVLKYLVIPSAHRSGSAFGSAYIHAKLIGKKSAFDRDRIWSGLDDVESRDVQRNFRNNVRLVLAEFDDLVYISEFDAFDEMPMLHTWALSNIDQQFRGKVRSALAGWAKKRPQEFRKLLDNFVTCNDPQIMEDLSSIALGLAGVLTVKSDVKLIAEWALTHIFANTDKHRNVVVRQGFRAIVERAYQLGGVNERQLAAARPYPKPLPSKLLPFSKVRMGGMGDEAYPIVHDLAWYVIKKVYYNFLEYPHARANSYISKDCKEGRALLQLYREKAGTPLFNHGWVMGTAIGYIRKTLGLTRKDGNTYTDESHGSKSKVFTYEEKYTWAAVHYLQGYLADYVPMKHNSTRKWISDYSKITSIPNPFDGIVDLYDLSIYKSSNHRFVVKENLAPTVTLEGDINQNIREFVAVKPVIDFGNWLGFTTGDFPEEAGSEKWIALQNDTTFEDATGVGTVRLEASAALISSQWLEALKQKVTDKPDSISFITSLDRLEARTDTDTYSNPSDAVWMDWVGEQENTEAVYLEGKNITMHLAVTKIVQRTTDGEKYYHIPSRIVRDMLGTKSYAEPALFDLEQNRVAFAYEASRGDYRDTQKIVVVNEAILEKALQKKRMKLIWWVEVYKSKNALNDAYSKYEHNQKCFKYLVWKEGNEYKSIQFWEEHFSNTRDSKRARGQSK